MALVGTSTKGTVGIAVESVSGEQTLLAATPGSATITGISAPTGSTGMKLHVYISTWLTSGTFTITGTGTPGNTETVTVPTPTAQQLQSPQLANFEYVSVNNYTAITNITTTGGLSAANTIFVVKGIYASKFNIPTTMFKSNHKTPLYSPNEHSGAQARDRRLVQMHNESTIDAFDTDFYGDLSLWWAYLLLGIPIWTSLPTVPTSLFAATALSGSQTLTTPPTAPGMKLIITITAFTVAGTITINGTSYGATVAEAISITGAGTYYSSNVYSAVTSITNVTTAATMAVTGVFGWKAVFSSESTRQTLAVEHFDGSASWIHPFVYATDGDFTLATKNEIKLTAKGGCFDKVAIGDRTTNPLQVSRVTSLGISLSDLPIMGWQSQVYMDPISGTAQTTVFTDPEDIKIVLKTPTEVHWTLNNQQEYTRIYPVKPECTVDLTYDILNLLQDEQLRQNLKQYLVLATIGEYIGTTGGVNYSKGWTWTLPGRYEGEFLQESDPTKGNVFAKPKFRCEYDTGIAASYQLVVITRDAPTYAA